MISSQSLIVLLLAAHPFYSQGFSVHLSRPSSSATSSRSASTTQLFLAKKKKKASPASAALEALDALDALDDIDAPMSKKELKALEKQKAKEAKAAAAADNNNNNNKPSSNSKEDLLAQALANEEAMEPQSTEDAPAADAAPPQKKLSKKEEMLAKALALEAMDEQDDSTASPYKEEAPKLSKKELKKLEKQEQKQREKEEKKRLKKLEKQQRLEAAGIDTSSEEETAAAVDTESTTSLSSAEEEAAATTVNGDADAAAVEAAPAPAPMTLEDKVRKERPPPRIRVMESNQPGYTNLRMEGIGITFRNQEVLKDVTWGVQTGDRIGLVGQNGAGKTTQLRIMAGELEPTTGDVVKSSKTLRVAMLRQEFVDELVLTRTLREEMLSVFDEENKILQELKETEAELENLGSDADPEKMQQILDRMQELQNEAENKEVYVLESRVQKVMDLMGFTDDEGDDLVASFSGGWKMRIGLGKVLLKDPNILLLVRQSRRAKHTTIYSFPH